MRKYRRMLLRSKANKLHAKASNFVHKMWERHQIKKYGPTTVAINKAKGTHKKSTWPARIQLFAYNQRKGRVA